MFRWLPEEFRWLLKGFRWLPEGFQWLPEGVRGLQSQRGFSGPKKGLRGFSVTPKWVSRGVSFSRLLNVLFLSEKK